MGIDFEREEREVSKLSSELDRLEIKIKEEKTALALAERSHVAATEAREHLQHLAKAVQQKVHQQLSKVVSTSLAAVFDDPYSFNIEFEMKRGQTEAVLQFIRNQRTFDPKSASGGGVKDVACFALRCACLVLHRPRISKVLVMDESFKFVSVDHRARVRVMLEKLSKEMGIQMILTTHMPELQTGKLIEL